MSNTDLASSIPDVNEKYEKLIVIVDRALYQAKSEGKNLY